MYYLVCRFDGGSNIVGFNDCLPINDTCPLSYRLNNDVREGDVIDIKSLSRTSGRSYTVNYSTSESMSVYFVIIVTINKTYKCLNKRPAITVITLLYQNITHHSLSKLVPVCKKNNMH